MFAALQYSYIQNALIAGSLVAIIGAVVGYFLVLRGLTFSGHALSHIGFAGAAGAVLFGVTPVFGLLVFTLGAGVGIGVLGKNARQRDIIIGILMMFALGLGSLFLSLYNGYAEEVYSVLFGQVLGVSYTDIITTAVSAIIVLGCIVVIFRPLLFSTVDPGVAIARGLPVRALSLIFLLLVAITVSLSVQFVGILLIFTLLVGPAATVMRLFRRPLVTIGAAMILGLLYVWIGILLAANGSWPVSFYITVLSFAGYMLVRLLTTHRSQRRVTSLTIPQEQSGAALTTEAELSEVRG
jgi:zinc/manganese transport system permease protein